MKYFLLLVLMVVAVASIADVKYYARRPVGYGQDVKNRWSNIWQPEVNRFPQRNILEQEVNSFRLPDANNWQQGDSVWSRRNIWSQGDTNPWRNTWQQGGGNIPWIPVWQQKEITWPTNNNWRLRPNWQNGQLW